MTGFDLRDERGSLLTFGIGVSIFVLMLVTVSVNVATMWTTKATLNSIADGAALSAAQGVDATFVYLDGARSPVALSERAVRLRVVKYLQIPQVRNQLTDLRSDSIMIHRDKVTVRLSCKPNLPFGYFLPLTVTRVRAVATAQEKIND